MLRLEDLNLLNLKIYQDDELYCFTSDAILLSRFASVKKGDVVADFCAGSGIVGVHYYALNKNAKSVDLIEIQPELSALSQKTVDVNGLGEIFTVINKPIQDLSSKFNGKYSLILCNPPYKKAGSGEVNGDRKIAMCRHEITVTQEEIIEISAKKLKHGGRLCMCQRTERFTDMVLKMASVGLSPTKVQFVVTKQGGAPYLFLIEAVKGVKPQLKILPEFVNEGV
jgi:tRNA1(Val) A37 N6-methylase TrmN6